MTTNWVPKGYSSTSRSPRERFRTLVKFIMVSAAMTVGAGHQLIRDTEDQPAQAMMRACLDKTYTPDIKWIAHGTMRLAGWLNDNIFRLSQRDGEKKIASSQSYYGFTPEELGVKAPEGPTCSPAEHKAMRHFQRAAALGLIGLAGMGAGVANYVWGNKIKKYRGPYPPGR